MAQEGRIWILFANGEGSRVNLSLHHGKSRGARPADAYVVTGGGLTRSARRAAEAVYNWLQKAGRNPDQFVAGFEVAEADTTMAGESGGLPFAVALAARLLNTKEISVAATGEIVSAHYPGKIGAVDGIEEKLSAGAALLGPGHFLCYPAENEHTISTNLKRDVEKKGIVLLPVASVADALDCLFLHRKVQSVGTAHSQTKSKKRFAIALCCIILLTGLAAAWRLQMKNPPANENVSIEASSPLPVEASKDGKKAVSAEPAAKTGETVESNAADVEDRRAEQQPRTTDHGFD